MKLHLPELATERLILRPYLIADSDRVKELAGNKKIYERTLNIPHPYASGMAEQWISSHLQQFYTDNGITLAVTLRDAGTLIGAIGLTTSKAHQRAELGYWIGEPFWGQGYCTEAARAIIDYGFKVLELHKITSRHMESNPASGRVMEKAGMTKEGRLVDEVNKDGLFHTLILYGLVNQ